MTNFLAIFDLLLIIFCSILYQFLTIFSSIFGPIIDLLLYNFSPALDQILTNFRPFFEKSWTVCSFNAKNDRLDFRGRSHRVRISPAYLSATYNISSDPIVSPSICQIIINKLKIQKSAAKFKSVLNFRCETWTRIHVSSWSNSSSHQWKYKFSSGDVVIFWSSCFGCHDSRTSLLSQKILWGSSSGLKNEKKNIPSIKKIWNYSQLFFRACLNNQERSERSDCDSTSA